jgi:V/A-type H+-transporting ATPase subunit D
MAKKIRLTRVELKRYRDALGRYERYLPMLKLKQQQLQITQNQALQRQRQARQAVAEAERAFAPSRELLGDLAGVNVRELGKPTEVKTSITNIAGLELPIFEDVLFPPVQYSLFGTPAWVDRALADLRELNRRRAQLDVFDRQVELIRRELIRVIQRVNLFEKVKIPSTREAIRVIRIALGDEQTAGVVRAKIAKGKLTEAEHQDQSSFATAGQEGEL